MSLSVVLRKNSFLKVFQVHGWEPLRKSRNITERLEEELALGYQRYAKIELSQPFIIPMRKQLHKTVKPVGQEPPTSYLSLKTDASNGRRGRNRRDSFSNLNLLYQQAKLNTLIQPLHN